MMKTVRRTDGAIGGRVCGKQLTATDAFCRICLEASQAERVRTLPRNKFLACVALPVLFLGSCSALLPLGMNIAEPMTHVPLGVSTARFPIVIITRGTPYVDLLTDPHRVPSLPHHASYLIPEGEVDSVEAAINAVHPPGAEGGWVLRVQRLGPARQRIELVWMNDGFVGGVYEARPRSIKPLHRKITGPGFAFVFGGIALATNVAIWSILLFGVRWWRGRAATRI